MYFRCACPAELDAQNAPFPKTFSAQGEEAHIHGLTTQRRALASLFLLSRKQRSYGSNQASLSPPQNPFPELSLGQIILRRILVGRRHCRQKQEGSGRLLPRAAFSVPAVPHGWQTCLDHPRPGRALLWGLWRWSCCGELVK
jgi:hypothetical protein